MPDIFGIDIAGIIDEVLSPSLFDQVLIKVSDERDATNPTKKNHVEVNHPCRGFVDNFSKENARGNSVRITDHKIIIIGNTLPIGVIPEPGDKIIAEGSTFTIVSEGVMRDPAGATYECRSR